MQTKLRKRNLREKMYWRDADFARAWQLMLLACALVWCGGCAASSASSSAGRTGVLRVAEGRQQSSWVRNFNPFAPDPRFPARAGMYEPLLIYNTLQARYVPWLATDYEFGENNTKITMHTRANVKWSDGATFSARDVEFTFNLMRQNPALDLRGVWKFLKDVRATDERTVEFTMQRSFVPGLIFIGHQPIVAQHVWRNVADPVRYTDDNPVATGPFTVVSTFQNQVYQVDRNPNYWQTGKPYISAVRLSAFPGNDQATLALLSDEVDWAGLFVPDVQRVFVERDKEKNHYWSPPIGNSVLLFLNNARPPFDNVQVRKALSLAIDRAQIVEVALYGNTRPADATSLSDAYKTWKSDEITGAGDWVEYNPQRAEMMLDAAGIVKNAAGARVLPDGSPLRVEIDVVTGWTDWVSTVQMIAQNLKAIGVDANLKTMDYGLWFDRQQKGEFIATIGTAREGPTPYDFYRVAMDGDALKPVGEPAAANYQRFQNADVNRALREFEATSDQTQQRELAFEMQRLFVANAPAIPLFVNPVNGEYVSTRFTNFPDRDNPYSKLVSYDDPEQLFLLTEVRPKE